jgi:hypothetical protein
MTKGRLSLNNRPVGKIRRGRDRVTGADGVPALAKGKLLGGSALLMIGASLLAACGSAATSTSDTAPVGTTVSPAADGASPLSLSTPAVISHAVVSRADPRATRPAKQATPAATPHSSSPSAGNSPGAAPAAPGGGVDPSGADPSTAMSGFTLKYVQDFTGSSLPAGWFAYNSVPGGESASVAQWLPGMCTFSGGEAHFLANGIDSCGLQYFGTPQTYGAWFARLKGDDQPSGLSFSDIFLLWPANNQWPPEIDIYEDNADRAWTSNSMYNTVGDLCGASPTSQCLQPYEQSNGQSGGIANDDTQWHTYGVEWTPSGVTWLLDGRVTFTAPASQVKSPARQPATPMYMDLQSQNLQGAGTPSQRESMTVDWVEEYSWNG